MIQKTTVQLPSQIEGISLHGPEYIKSQFRIAYLITGILWRTFSLYLFVPMAVAPPALFISPIPRLKLGLVIFNCTNPNPSFITPKIFHSFVDPICNRMDYHQKLRQGWQPFCEQNVKKVIAPSGVKHPKIFYLSC